MDNDIFFYCFCLLMFYFIQDNTKTAEKPYL